MNACLRVFVCCFLMGFSDLRSALRMCVIDTFLGIAIVIVSTGSENEKATLVDYFYEYIQYDRI